jgi:hypothetical protein
MRLFLLLPLLLSYSLAVAETSQERGKRIVDEALAALGGDKFLAMKDRIESGRAYSFYRSEVSGLSLATIYTRYLTRPEPPPPPGTLFVREREAFGKDQDVAVLFDEKNAWEITFRGARPIDPERIDRYRDTTLRNIFYILRQRLGEKGLIMEARGTDIWDNQPVQTVDITDADNRVVTVYFHYSTKLPARQVFTRRDPKTRVPHEEETVYSKYRDVGDGVQWPFVIQRQRDGEKIFTIFSESVSINQNLTDELFTLPVNLKLLPRAK